MASIDERVVSMAFENAKFEAGVAQTMATLAKLNAELAKVGSVSGFGDIDKAASKVTLDAPMSALDKLKQKLGLVGANAADSFSDIERGGNKVTLSAPGQAIDKLRQKLAGVGANAADGFNDIERASNKVTLEGVGRAVDAATNKFSILQGAAAVALGSIAAMAAARGAQIGKSLALGGITDGFREYATNLNSIQTILANTQADGSNLQDVNKALQDLNKYSDQTIYNFGEMARNIGTFTAAGVKLGPATESIKGIANLAALSGSNSQQASTAMYQLSQAIAAGKVNLQDWNSVVNAGMGGQVFQKALFNTAKAMGTITSSPVGQTFEEWKKAGNSFRQSLSATQKAANDGAKVTAKAQADAAKLVSEAEESAAESVKSASDRVTEARKSVAEAAEQAAKDIQDAQQAQTDAVKKSGEDVAAALQDVRTARQDVAQSAKDSVADIADAQRAHTEAIKQSAADVKAALDDVREARQRLVDAMKPPSQDELEAASDSLRTAQLDQLDLADAIELAQREQVRATEDLTAAQGRLTDAKTKGDAEAIAQAQRAVEDAQTRVTDATDAQERALLRQKAATREVTDATQTLQDVQKKGTDADENVIAARDNLTAATHRYTEAQKSGTQSVKDAAKDVAKAEQRAGEARAETARKLAEAQQKYGQAQIKAQEDVADAAQHVADVQEEAADRQKEAGRDLAQAQTDQVEAVKDAQKQIAEAHESAAERVAQARASMTADKGPQTWLTSDVLTNTLRQFTGDMSKAELKAQGFTDAQIKAIQKMADTAKDSATKVKTLSQVFDIAKETIGSGWANTFKLIFGNFKEARETFTNLSNTINGFINTNANARNKVIKDWRALGGRTDLIEGIKNIFEAIGTFLKPIKDAFRQIFPATTGKQLADITKNFRDLADSLKLDPDTQESLRKTFAGLFAVLHIGVTVVKEVVRMIGRLLGVAGEGSGGFLKFTGSIGDFLVALDNALTKGGALTGLFDGLTAVLKVPLRLLGLITTAIFGLFTGDPGGSAAKFSAGMDDMSRAAGPLKSILDGLSTAWDKLSGILEKVRDLVTPWLSQVGEAFSDFGQIVADQFNSINWDTAFGAIQTGLIAGLFLAIRKAIKGGIGIDLGGGVLENLSKTFKALTGNLQAMQKNIQAGTLLKIAGAIGVLAAAVTVLSMIEPEKLNRAMTAVAIGLGELVGALALLSKVSKGGAFLTLPLLSASLIALSTAVLILAGAVKIFSTMNWEELAKGLIGVGGALTAVGVGAKFIGPSIIPAALGMIPLAIALNILALAVKQFGDLDMTTLAKGIGAIGISLGIIALGMSLMPPTMLLTGAGLIAVGVGLTAVAGAVAMFGAMRPQALAKGILGVAASLVTIGLAVALIPPTLALQAAGLVILGVALTEIAVAIGILGKLKIVTLAKGIGALAVLLLELAVGLTAMAGTLPGSVALLAAASALAILAPTLAFLGTLKWSTIFKGLAAIALALGTLAVTGLLAAPALLALGIAMVPLGVGFAAIAGAAYLFAKAMAVVGADGTKAAAALVVALTALAIAIPKIILTFLEGIVGIAGSVAALAPKVLTALGLMIDQIIAFVIASAPKLAEAIGVLVQQFAEVMFANAPTIIAAGLGLLVAFLTGITQNIGKIVESAGLMIVTFLGSLKKQVPAIIAGGLGVLVNFLKGITVNLPRFVKTVFDMVTKFLAEVTKNLPRVIAQGVKFIVAFLDGIASHIGEVIRSGARIVVKFIQGIGNALPEIIKAGLGLARKFLTGLANGLANLADIGFKAIIRFLHGLEAAIRKNTDTLFSAGAGVADAIIDGMVDQFGKLGGVLRSALEKVFSLLPKWAKKVLGIASPSKVFAEIGKFTMLGMVQGLTEGGDGAVKSVDTVARKVVRAAQDSLANVPDLLDGIMDLDPTITPVLDLSSVEAQAKKLGDLTATTPIVATVSSDTATAVASETQASQTATADAAAGINIELNQTNTSPKALDEVEIYRQTKNQIAQVKSALGVT